MGTNSGQPKSGPSFLRRHLQPQIIERVNNYDVRVAHAKGEHVWHVHGHTDEISSCSRVASRWLCARPTAACEVSLSARGRSCCAEGVEHKPSSLGASILMFEPSGTSTTGDRHHGEIPDYLETTTGHDIRQTEGGTAIEKGA